MNKKITIYDLLGLIKDGKPPKKIIYDNKKYFIEVHDYSLNDEKVFWLFKDNNIIQIMTKKVEILEEDKPIIEKLDVALLSQSDNWLWCPSKDEFSKDIELNSYIIQNIRENTLYFQRKINEIIDYINRKENK